MSNTQKQPMCFGCIHSNIIETSHEWIECKCKADGHWHDPFESCNNYEEERKENEDE